MKKIKKIKNKNGKIYKKKKRIVQRENGEMM